MQRAALVGVVLLGAAGSAAGQSAGTAERPAKASSYSAVGWASWYGREFHGRRTADGETFDMGALTAAHKTMPLPCYARVTNLRNGRSMVVRVNDRGPFVGERLIDVSARVANLLDFQRSGLTKVKVDYVGMAPLGGVDGPALLASLKTREFARRRRQRLCADATGRRRPCCADATRRRRSHACADSRRRLCAAASGKRRFLRVGRAGGGEPPGEQRAGANGEPANRRRLATIRRLRPTADGRLALRRSRAVARRAGGVALADGGDAPISAPRFARIEAVDQRQKQRASAGAPFVLVDAAATAARTITRPSSCRAPSAPRRECRRAKRPSRPSRTGRSLPFPRPLRAP